jgi:outer membrane protein assembly factor BamB
VPEIPSPLVYRDRIYLIRNGGLLACRDLATGKVIFNERIDAPGGYFASPIAADGRLYLASDRGTITVAEAGDQLHVLARNDLAEPVFASPAAVDETLYIRGSQHLWAFRR